MTFEAEDNKKALVGKVDARYKKGCLGCPRLGLDCCNRCFSKKTADDLLKYEIRELQKLESGSRSVTAIFSEARYFIKILEAEGWSWESKRLKNWLHFYARKLRAKRDAREAKRARPP